MKTLNKMENSEEVFHFLEEFSKRKPKTIPQELNDYLSYVARTGDPVYHWPLLKSLFKEKLLNVMTEFYETTPGIDIPTYPNVDPFNYETMKNSLLERFDTFTSAPFTVQRICELLTCPRKQYNRIDKFMRAIEKNILVVSTIEPGSQRHIEPENNDVNERILNGSDNNSECHVDVEMEDISCKENSDHVLDEQSCATDSNMTVEETEPSSAENQNPELICPETSNTCYESLTPPSSDEEQTDSLKLEENNDNSSQDSEKKAELPIVDQSTEIQTKSDDDTSETLVIPKIVIEGVEISETNTSKTASNEVQDLPLMTSCPNENESNQTETNVNLEVESNIENKECDLKNSDSSVLSEESLSSDSGDCSSNSPKHQPQQILVKKISLADYKTPQFKFRNDSVPEETSTEVLKEIVEEVSDSNIQSDTYSVSDIKSEITQEPSAMAETGVVDTVVNEDKNKDVTEVSDVDP